VSRTVAVRYLVVGLFLGTALAVGRLPAVGAGDCGVTVLISAVHFNSALSGEPDEGVELYNPGPQAVDLAGWALADGEGRVTFPAVTLPSGGRIWVAREAVAFRRQFGFAPALEYGADTDPDVPNLTGTAPVLANAGDEVLLTDPCGNRSDVVVYKGGATTPGWLGPTLTPYTSGDLSETAQILYRRPDPATFRPAADTDSAADWAQFRGDPLTTRKVRYPGWDLESHFIPYRTTEVASLTVAVAPDASYLLVRNAILGASRSISVAVYTLEHPGIVDALRNRLAAGVQVRVLLEGAPAGGLSDAERWACREVEGAGGQCWFMTTLPGGGRRRYPNMHAKYLLVDDRQALVSTENFGPSGLPADDFTDGTAGSRGAVLVTDAAGVIAHLRDLFAADLDPGRPDIRRWDPTADGPPPGFRPPGPGGGTGYTPAFAAPLTTSGTFEIEVIRSPENSLQAGTGLMGLLGRVGAGDEVLVQALYEPPFWGGTGASPLTDPNPRLEAMVGAARRGGRVHLLLDGLYGNTTEPTSNRATCDYLGQIAAREGLDLGCRLGNPTGLGIHSKLVIVRTAAQGWVHVGSINGSEVSSKANREVALQFNSRAAADYLAAVFWADWNASGPAPRPQLWLPLVRLR
jgi:phosphatidylserine/phosphatidylglycerophosphate/cardiolipin synthase-like enzyme